MSQPVATQNVPDTTMTTLVEVLREQLQQAQQEKARLLAMLEAGQQARRDQETKRLPAPRPAPVQNVWLRLLVVLLMAVLAFAGWHFRAAIVAALTP